MSKWRTIRHVEDTKGKTEHYTCELWLKFPKSIWNKSEESPVIKITYSDRKYEETYWLDKNKTKSYTLEPSRSCVIEVNYIQRHTQVVLYSGTHGEPNYNDFTLEYCKVRAEKIFTDRLTDLINQII
jgi:hypothetical protein